MISSEMLFSLHPIKRLGRGDFVSLMGKTRPLVKSLGVLTYEEEEEEGYGR